MVKGDIVLVPFPFTDLSGQKVRPALILFASKRGEDCIVAFISSRQEKKIRMFDIRVGVSRASGLKVSSLIKLDKIAALQKKIVLGKLGAVEPLLIAEVDKKLKHLFNL